MPRLKPITDILSEDDLEKLRASGLNDTTIRENRLRTSTDFDELKDILNRNDCSSGLVIPYRGMDGKVNGFARVRPHRPRRNKKGRDIKYEQPMGESIRPYIPKASIKRIKNGDDLLITEGEIKAAALSQAGYCALGICGVDCGIKDGELIPELKTIVENCRKVFICFDYDEKKKTRDNVNAAKKRLAKALAKEDAEVYDIELPPGEDGEKQGVDDFLVSQGADAFAELVKQAEPIEYARINSLIYLIKLTPPLLGDDSRLGLVGEYLDAIQEYTEATDAGVLAHLLPAAGAYIGDGPYVWAGDKQPARLNTVLVGPTSSGRKGTSRVPVRVLMETIDSEFLADQWVSGLSSGEGLIQKVSDEKEWDEENKKYETIPVEKRLYVTEPEFSKVLMHARREGNILSQVLRETYDSGNIATLTRNPLAAQNAHICITGHITPEELKERLTKVDMANGFGNRFLWFAVKSDKELPLAEPIPDKVVGKFSKKFKSVFEFAKKQERISLNETAKEMWADVYSVLREDRPGFAGALTARGESIVLRIALLYCLLNKQNVVSEDHLNAALAIWEYNVASCQQLFRDKSETTLADKILKSLENGPMTKTEFHTHQNVSSYKLGDELKKLEHQGLIRRTTKKKSTGAGRPAEVWERT